MSEKGFVKQTDAPLKSANAQVFWWTKKSFLDEQAVVVAVIESKGAETGEPTGKSLLVCSARK